LWKANNNDISNKNSGNVGVGTTTPENKFSVVDKNETAVKNYSGLSAKISSPTESRAIYGASTNVKGLYNYGGYFTAAGQSSGVFGEASDTINGEAGGVFHSYGESGRGVIGLGVNSTTNLTNYGGWFDARGVNGVGIFAKGGVNGYAGLFNGNVGVADRNGQKVIEMGKGEGSLIVGPEGSNIYEIRLINDVLPVGTESNGYRIYHISLIPWSNLWASADWVIISIEILNPSDKSWYLCTDSGSHGDHGIDIKIPGTESWRGRPLKIVIMRFAQKR
jgi:hypothetical protein